MKLLIPNYPPLSVRGFSGWTSEFEAHLHKAESIMIVSGYVSEAALARLDEILRGAKTDLPRLRSLDLVVGMAFFDGLTERQKMALRGLQRTLTHLELGHVYVPMFMKVHSKCTVFVSGESVSALLGSTNLTALVPHRQSELDLLVESPSQQAHEAKLYVETVFEHSTKIDERVLAAIPTIRAVSSRLPLRHGVFTVSPGQAPESANPMVSFDLPIKTERKSNLNKFNAAPRGRIPRSWWEVELIIPTDIQRESLFPSHVDGSDEFFVFTDDGFSFRCHVSGGPKPRSNKNFESSGDLQILGLWIKGRLVEAGCLEEGDFVTQEVLDCYGRNSLSFVKLDSPHCWAIDFSRKD